MRERNLFQQEIVGYQIAPKFHQSFVGILRHSPCEQYSVIRDTLLIISSNCPFWDWKYIGRKLWNKAQEVAGFERKMAKSFRQAFEDFFVSFYYLATKPLNYCTVSKMSVAAVNL